MIAGWALMGVCLVGLVALREFHLLDLDLALGRLPEPGLSALYLYDLLASVLSYAAVLYYFGTVLKLWNGLGRPRAAREP